MVGVLMVSELMRRAGFDNLAPRYGLKRTGDLPLDQLLANPPQVLLAGRLAPGEPSWGDRVLSHNLFGLELVLQDRSEAPPSEW